jgi:hypothetical protein
MGTKSSSELEAQIKGEFLILVPEATVVFFATHGALQSINESENVSFYTS